MSERRLRSSISARTSWGCACCGKSKRKDFMPTSPQARILLRTYTCDAGSAPTMMTASPGTMPRSRRSATRAFSPRRMSAATATPSMILAMKSAVARMERSEMRDRRPGLRFAPSGLRKEGNLLRGGAPCPALAVAAFDVVDHHVLEVGGERRAAQGRRLLAVDEHRRGRLLAGAGQRDADVGVLALARPVDDAAHHGDVERLDARIARLPLRHRVADEALDVAGELLERRRGGAAATRAGRDQRHEHAEAHGLQDLLRDLHFERAVAARLGRERDADGVADALLQQDAERRGGANDALRTHAGFGQAEMQRV